MNTKTKKQQLTPWNTTQQKKFIQSNAAQQTIQIKKFNPVNYISNQKKHSQLNEKIDSSTEIESKIRLKTEKQFELIRIKPSVIQDLIIISKTQSRFHLKPIKRIQAVLYNSKTTLNNQDLIKSKSIRQSLFAKKQRIRPFKSVKEVINKNEQQEINLNLKSIRNILSLKKYKSLQMLNKLKNKLNQIDKKQNIQVLKRYSVNDLKFNSQSNQNYNSNNQTYVQNNQTYDKNNQNYVQNNQTYYKSTKIQKTNFSKLQQRHKTQEILKQKLYSGPKIHILDKLYNKLN